MAGWNLKSGELLSDKVSDDELWSLFSFVFSDSCHKTNTYKFGLIKSICDQVYDLYDYGCGYYLSYEKIFSKFTENYWNLVAKYHIKQMYFNGKSKFSKIEKIIIESINKEDLPSELVFQSINPTVKDSIIKSVATECKKCVIGALYNDFGGKLYSFDLKGSGIYLSSSAYEFICKYKIEIEKINYYSWAMFLEKINDDDALIRVLDKLEMATPRRTDLSLYREILFKEFEENTCFYCGEKFKRVAHVDHFIPWSFIKTDNLWNFVLACPKCNIKKKDRLVSLDYVLKIEERNKAIISNLHNKNTFVNVEYTGYQSGTINKMWNYARSNGLKENKML